jgi:large subunit ribosomal protein L25
VPAVVYGGKKEPELIALDRTELTKAWNTGNFLTQLIMVDLDGKQTRALPRDVQVHPVTDAPLHVDFLRLDAGARIKLMIPVHFVNDEESPGIKRGGVLNVVRHEVELDCPAENIPESLTADLTGFDIGDSLHISAIALPDGVRPTITDRDFTVATVAAPTIEVVEVETPEGEDAEGEEGAEGAEGEGDGEAPAEGGGDDAKDKSDS